MKCETCELLKDEPIVAFIEFTQKSGFLKGMIGERVRALINKQKQTLTLPPFRFLGGEINISFTIDGSKTK